MARRLGSTYYVKEERTVSESRLKSLTKAQQFALARCSKDIWVTAKEVGTTSAAMRTLAKKGLVLTSVIEGEMCYKLGTRS